MVATILRRRRSSLLRKCRTVVEVKVHSVKTSIGRPVGCIMVLPGSKGPQTHFLTQNAQREPFIYDIRLLFDASNYNRKRNKK